MRPAIQKTSSKPRDAQDSKRECKHKTREVDYARFGANLFCMRSHPRVSHSNAPYARALCVCRLSDALREGVVGGWRASVFEMSYMDAAGNM